MGPVAGPRNHTRDPQIPGEHIGRWGTTTLLDRNDLAPVPRFILPGAPIFKELRAASEAVSRSAGPLPDLLCTGLSAAHSQPAARYRCLHVSKLSWPA